MGLGLVSLYIGTRLIHGPLHPASLKAPRRRLPRTSEELSFAQCQNITEAAWFALDIGLPLNRYITINWTAGGVRDSYAATARYLKWAGDWLADRRIPLAYCWVRENVGGDHVHILIHVPAALRAEFSRMQRQWRRRVLGGRSGRGVVNTRPVGLSYDSARTASDHYRPNLDYLLRYLLKGASADAALFTDHRRCWSGVVEGRRYSVSVTLNRTARMVAASFQSGSVK